MKTALRLTFAAFGLATLNLSAATLYVSLESTNPVPPYATWATAATNIQDAVDVSKAGDTVLVTNGVYAVGSREVSVLDTNQEPPQLVSNGPSRVAVTNSIRLESVNGPLMTTIDGGGRCVYLGSNAVLSGFTLTNGGSNTEGGGVFCEPSGVVTNCTLTGNWTYGRGGGAYGGTLYNCTLSGNEATPPSFSSGAGAGGGAYGCTLYNCTLTDNHANGGGPIAQSRGGGACEGTLYNCTLTGNSAAWGGGASGSTLNNCTVAGNVNDGVYGSTLYNCTVTGNSGGGAWDSALYNCTVTGNDSGGITHYNQGSTLFNSIIYYNFGGNHDQSTTLNYCCTTPLPTNGVGNITGPPLFMDMAAGDFRLREESPCIDAGTNLVGFSATVTNDWGDVSFIAYTHDPTDMLGNTRFIDGNFDGRVAWDIGAYEFNSFRPPRFSMAPQLTPDGWKLNITGAPNKWVHVQRSSDLKNWEDVWSGWMGTDGVHQCTDGDMGPKVMFYRVVVE